jgi:uncharacterized protein (TIGR03437 family)
MLHADDQQVNVQVPWELAGEQSVQIVVNLSDATSTPYTANVAPFSPAIYVRAGIAAAQDDPNFNLITSSNPAQRGHDIHLYVNGLGAVDHPPATGTPVAQGTLVHTLSTPTVTVGGKNATVLFSGLAPLFPGLNQIDIKVPDDAPTGTPDVVVSIGGITSPAVKIPVQ